VLVFLVTSQDFFDSRIMDVIRKRLTGREINCEISGSDVTLQRAVSTIDIYCSVICCCYLTNHVVVSRQDKWCSVRLRFSFCHFEFVLKISCAVFD